MIKTRKRKIKISRVLFLCCTVGLFVCTIFMGISGLLEGIRLPTELQSRNSDGNYISNLSDTIKIAVHYPTFDSGAVNEISSALAEKIMNDVLNLSFEDEEYVNVDYHITDYNGEYVGVEYILDYDNFNRTYTYFGDYDGQEMNGEEFDDYLKQKIVEAVRIEAKTIKELKDYAYSADFALDSANGEMPNANYSIANNKLYIMYDDFYQGVELMANINLSDISSHINLDLGIDSSSEAIVAPLKRIIDPNRPMIALTFDDGPYEPYTRQIIDVLYQYDGVATFYMLGTKVKEQSQEQIIIDLINNGNEIGSHTVSHRDLRTLNAEDFAYETNEVQRYINEEITNGLYTVNTIRAPYGSTDENIRANTRYPYIMWNVDPEDWKHRDRDTSIRTVKEHARDGAIIIMHDIHKPSVEAAIEMIKYLKEEGYQLVTVSEMMEAKGITMEDGKVYYSGN